MLETLLAAVVLAGPVLAGLFCITVACVYVASGCWLFQRPVVEEDFREEER